MIKKLKQNIWQLYFREFGSCVYLIKENNKKILIDTSSYAARDELLENLSEIEIDPKEIDLIILTHNHWDHIQNIELFKNAKIYSSENLDENTEIKEIPELKILSTPGHAEEAKCYLYKGILFSGDTIFDKGYIGRVDLPGSSMEKMKESLEKLQKIEYEILAPGHLR